MQKTRTVILYDFLMEVYNLQGVKTPKDYSLSSEIEKILVFIMSFNDLIDRTIKYESEKKIVYLDSFNKSITKKHTIFNLKFASAKYDTVRPVVDTETMKERGKLKTKKDGDVELSHISIAIVNKDSGKCALEFNNFGIRIGKIVGYLNTMSELCYNTKKEQKFYKFSEYDIPNAEFLAALKDMKRISLASFFIDKREINTSDFADLSGRSDINDIVELALKPIKRGKTIQSKTIEQYLDKKTTNQKILRIRINGEGPQGPIKLDTESMNSKFFVVVNTNTDGVVETTSIEEELKKLLFKMLSER